MLRRESIYVSTVSTLHDVVGRRYVLWSEAWSAIIFWSEGTFPQQARCVLLVINIDNRSRLGNFRQEFHRTKWSCWRQRFCEEGCFWWFDVFLWGHTWRSRHLRRQLTELLRIHLVFRPACFVWKFVRIGFVSFSSLSCRVDTWFSRTQVQKNNIYLFALWKTNTNTSAFCNAL